MESGKTVTCYYKYVLGGREKAGQTELSEAFQEPTSRDFLSMNLISVVKAEEPDFFLLTPEQRETSGMGEWVGPAKIVFGWDAVFERGTELGAIDGYDFYRKNKLLKP